MSNEEQETIADIVAWIRRHASVYGYDLADRIEAAYERERKPARVAIETPEEPDCESCGHFCGFHLETDFEIRESMLTVKCPMQVWATPDIAKTCNHYRRKATAQQ